MAFDSAVPVEGVQEKSTVVKSEDEDSTKEEAVKDNLGKLAEKPGIEQKK